MVITTTTKPCRLWHHPFPLQIKGNYNSSLSPCKHHGHPQGNSTNKFHGWKTPLQFVSCPKTMFVCFDIQFGLRALPLNHKTLNLTEGARYCYPNFSGGATKVSIPEIYRAGECFPVANINYGYCVPYRKAGRCCLGSIWVFSFRKGFSKCGRGWSSAA